ncbi:coil containing protein [Vibrio phage 1.052.A._10N.286.46.C3]|nr:coil containing protein [Vibrio phage 1.052.A._10N.286.46.C3]
MKEWLNKIASYAPDIAAAVATGGSSLAVTGLRILGKELLGTESATESDIEKAVNSASPEKLVELTKANNRFKVEMKALDNEDKHNNHKTTQETIRAGDSSDSRFVRYTRPGQAWVSLGAAIWLAQGGSSVEVVGAFLVLPFTYAGLRQFGKWKTASAIAGIVKK